MASRKTIPYGRQLIDESDIQAVCDALRSDWVTTGPAVEAFEQAAADYAGAGQAVAVTSGTAALHAAMYAAGVGPGDEVIVPPMTFAATANAVVFQQGRPVFADVDPGTLLIDPSRVEEKITARTKAVIAVDYTGQPCDYDALRKIADRNNLILVADACHSLGAQYKGRKAGALADLNVFSFHPVKHITTGEGGMVATDSEVYARRMRSFRNHCIDSDYRQREEKGSWFYEMKDLGYNYRITDFQCALGTSQLKKLPQWVKARRAIAAAYDRCFAGLEGIEPLRQESDRVNAYHLYVVRVKEKKGGVSRADLFGRLQQANIRANVHYIPVHFHPYYRERFGLQKDLCPVAEEAYEEIISLPMYPGLSSDDLEYVISTIEGIYKKSDGPAKQKRG